MLYNFGIWYFEIGWVVWTLLAFPMGCIAGQEAAKRDAMWPLVVLMVIVMTPPTLAVYGKYFTGG